MDCTGEGRVGVERKGALEGAGMGSERLQLGMLASSLYCPRRMSAACGLTGGRMELEYLGRCISLNNCKL